MHMNVFAVPQYPSRYSDKQTSRQEEKTLKSKTKKSQAFCSLRLYLHWKEDIVYLVNIVAVIIYN